MKNTLLSTGFDIFKKIFSQKMFGVFKKSEKNVKNGTNSRLIVDISSVFGYN